MEVEFDKEMDAILRKARAGEVVTSAGTHLDADEISAFAESAVSDAARQRFTAHLADCTRCRKILSNTILLNSEAETETASSAVSAKVVEERVPWYRKFFVFPQLAYTMGAMVLLFSGFFGYLILQNLPTADRAVSYSTENRAIAQKPAPQAATNAASNSNASSNSSVSSIPLAPSNTTSTTNTTSTANSASIPGLTTTPAATPERENNFALPESNAPVVSQPTPAADVKPQEQQKSVVDGQELAKSSRAAPTSPTAGAGSENRAKEEKLSKNKDASVSDDDKKADSERDLRLESRPVPKSARKQPSNAGETRNVGGKTFNNVGGIWFDSAVGKKKQKTVRRGTSEYLRLDAGLRSIADNLGGTVVILWNGKAYRIQ